MRRTFPSILCACAVAVVAACGESQEQVSQNTQAASTAPRYLIKFTDHALGSAAVARLGGAVVLDLPRHSAAAAHLPQQALTALQANPHVEYIELDPERHLMAQTTPYGITMVQATDPAFATPPAALRTVCVIDSGIYPGHEDFSGIPVTGSDGNLPWDQDGCGHGTHVAGTIAAANNGLGVIGVAPQAVALHIVRVFDDSCSWAYASNLVAALDACMDAGAHVVNMSLGGSNPSRTEAAAFDQAFNAGVLSVAAAGNAGNPSKLSGAIT